MLDECNFIINTYYATSMAWNESESKVNVVEGTYLEEWKIIIIDMDFIVINDGWDKEDIININ